jgi:hypothetical protein
MDYDALRAQAALLRPTPERLALEAQFRMRILKTCAVLLLGTFVFRTVLAWFKLRHVSGPTLASFSNLWNLQKSLSGNLCIEHGHACEEYGRSTQVESTLMVPLTLLKARSLELALIQ